MINQQLAKDILNLVGGQGNIKSVIHCATRLRFQLVDESKADTNSLNNHKGIIKVVQSGGQYQVVIGSHVADVHEALNELMGGMTSENTPSEKKGVVSTAIDVISSIFTPFLGVIAGAGILKGVLNLLIALGVLNSQTGAYQLLYTAADGIFYFMPMALAITAARKFKTNEFIALALAMALLYPGFTKYAASVAEAGGSLNFLGLPIIFSAAIGGYTSTVIPIIMAVWVQSFVEKLARKVVPNVIRIFGVTALTLLIMVPLTYIVIGPIGLVLGQIIGGIFKGLYGFNPIIAGLVLGGTWQVLVMFGMHWGLVPIALSNLATTGMDFLIPMSLAGVLAQAGAALGVFLATKDSKLKALAGSGTITALFGITEPTVYGVTLPLKKPFIFACVGGAIGGAITAASGVIAYAFGQSILTLPSMINPTTGDTSKMVIAVIAYVVAFAFAAVMTVFFGGVNKTSSDSKQRNEVKSIELYAPLQGQAVALESISDEVFASGAVGKGIAIVPSNNKVVAPASGTVALVFPTKHAIGVKTDDGVEVLIHIGMDTVELGGEGFTVHVNEGDNVEKGQLLVTFDEAIIRLRGKSLVTPVVITNTSDYEKIDAYPAQNVNISNRIIEIKK